MGWPFLDSDHVIEERLGCSVREYFEREGEERFRDVEQAVIADLAQNHDGVLSTGGGSVLRVVNRQALRQGGSVFYLRSAPEDVFRRIRHDQTRPLLQVADPLERIRDLYSQRDALYRDTAHYVIDTGRPTVASLVNKIQMQLELASAVVATPIGRTG
jgi:shikimate kinase